jgi:hypothetical protein
MNNAYKIGLGILAAGILVYGAVALATATEETPSEQLDGCDHGASEKPCRPDPQPDRGKDCEVHGRVKVGGSVGGINEDHCSSVTTTTTVLETTTTTTTETTDVTVTEVPVAPVEPVVTSSAPVLPAAVAAQEGITTTPATLPFTGAASGLLAGLGFGMVAIGTLVRRYTK